MNLRRAIRNWRNPFNETAVHLAPLVRRHGFAIGAHSYGRPKVRFAESGERLAIGRFCSIADRVEILLGGNHRADWATTFPFAAFPGRWTAAPAEYHASRGGVTIGSDVWLGSGCMVLSGVTIGSGAIVAARAVVSRDVPPYAVVAGNPARLVRLRFEPDRIEALLASAWWELPDDAVATLVPLLSSGRIDDLVAAVTAIRRGPGAR